MLQDPTIVPKSRPVRDAPLVDEVLQDFRAQLGGDYAGYRNHVCRVVSLCELLAPLSDVDRRQLQIAACFHDLAIWTHHTFDYLAPSCALAADYLERNERTEYADQVLRIIENHHKIRRAPDRLSEYFRRADWIDVSFGALRFGVPRSHVRALQLRYPDAGFHARLLKLSLRQLLRRPLQPFPMLRF